MATAKASVQGILVFYGGEDFLLDRDLSKARRWEGRSVTVLDGHGLDDYELVTICMTPTMDGTPRVVVLDDAQKVKGKSLKGYIEERDPADTSLILVAIVRAEKLPEIWAQAASKGKAVERRKLKTWDNNNEVVMWIDSEAARLGIKLQKGLSQALYDTVGADLYRLASEVQKLALLVGKHGEATMADLKLTISPSPSAEPWQVAEAMIQRDTRRAMNLLSTLYKNQGDDANVPLVSAMMKQVEKVTLARQMLDAGCSEEEIAALVEMNPKRVKFFFLPHVRKHNLGALVGHMAKLCQLDVDVKGPGRSKRTLIEMTVLSISG